MTALAASPVVTGLAAPATVPAATAASAGLTISFAVPAGSTAAASGSYATRAGRLTVIGKQTQGAARGQQDGPERKGAAPPAEVAGRSWSRSGSAAGGGVGAPSRTVVSIV